MHEAKTGNSICSYSDAMKRDSLMRISTIQHLREDLRGGFFHMVYQPIHDRTGKVSSAEALLRWENKDASIGPDYFIPLLEVSGLMPEMGELILRLVLKDLGVRIRGADSFPLISINLSPQQLKIDGLGVSIADKVVSANIPLERLQFEVTESAFLDHAGVGVANLTYLRSRGSPIAMDDFGTGYSNLGYLRNLPIDKIKVDQSFVRTVPGDQSAEGLLTALSDIGKSYNMKLVAEGVETEAQLKFLHATGFDEYQGYLYSQPLPCNDFLRYIDVLIKEAIV
jgi:EAL domain-containing protein (putative c-di-GMP-specific phosphodiesterase class I)